MGCGASASGDRSPQPTSTAAGTKTAAPPTKGSEPIAPVVVATAKATVARIFDLAAEYAEGMNLHDTAAPRGPPEEVTRELSAALLFEHSHSQVIEPPTPKDDQPTTATTTSTSSTSLGDPVQPPPLDIDTLRTKAEEERTKREAEDERLRQMEEQRRTEEEAERRLELEIRQHQLLMQAERDRQRREEDAQRAKLQLAVDAILLEQDLADDEIYFDEDKQRSLLRQQHVDNQDRIKRIVTATKNDEERRRKLVDYYNLAMQGTVLTETCIRADEEEFLLEDLNGLYAQCHASAEVIHRRELNTRREAVAFEMQRQTELRRLQLESQQSARQADEERRRRQEIAEEARRQQLGFDQEKTRRQLQEIESRKLQDAAEADQRLSTASKSQEDAQHAAEEKAQAAEAARLAAVDEETRLAAEAAARVQA